MEPKWLEWAKELKALSQDGLNYVENVFDKERYSRVSDIAAEMMAHNSDADLDYIKKLFNGQEGHATPKVDVRGVVFKENKILLVKEKLDGGWTVPGGWADPNETPSESVEREVFEESGFIVKAKKILAVYDRKKHGHVPPHPFHVYKIFFLCELTGGEKTLSIETDGVEFFKEDKIPELSKARTTPKQIARMYELFKNHESATDFD